MKIDPLAIVIGMAAAWYLLRRQEATDAETTPATGDGLSDDPSTDAIVAPEPLGSASDFLDDFRDAASDIIQELGK